MPNINNKKCDGCGTCVSVCPNSAIIMPDTAEIIADLCINCNLCVKICPIAAIELK